MLKPEDSQISTPSRWRNHWSAMLKVLPTTNSYTVWITWTRRATAIVRITKCFLHSWYFLVCLSFLLISGS